MSDNRQAARSQAFARVLAIAHRNPGVNSDDLLEELEAMDEARKLARLSDGPMGTCEEPQS